MKIVLTGPKCSGKTELGRLLARAVSLEFYDTDEVIEELFKNDRGISLSCRAICAEYGEDFFRDYERRAVRQVSKYSYCVVATGGSTMLNKESRELLRKDSIVVLLYASTVELYERLTGKIAPVYLYDKTFKDLFAIRANLVVEVTKPFADIVINSSKSAFKKTVTILVKELRENPKFQELFLTTRKSPYLNFIGKIDAEKYLFAVTHSLCDGKKANNIEKLLKLYHKQGIVIKKQTFADSESALLSFFSVEVKEKLAELILSLHKKYFLYFTDKEEIMTLFLQGLFARKILELIGIKITSIKKTFKKNSGFEITVVTSSTAKHKYVNIKNIISLFTLFFVDIKLPTDHDSENTKNINIFLQKGPISSEKEQLLSEILSAYISLTVLIDQGIH